LKNDEIEFDPVGGLARTVHFVQKTNENSPIAGAAREEFACSAKVG
jgi:hypothetical protein